MKEEKAHLLAKELIALVSTVIFNYFDEKGISFLESIPAQFLFLLALVCSTCATISEFSDKNFLSYIDKFQEKLKAMVEHHGEVLASVKDSFPQETNAY